MRLAGIDVIESDIDVTFRPTDDERQAAYEFGVKVAKKVKE
jgi:flavorubredoxin